jgi:hypothetical protein
MGGSRTRPVEFRGTLPQFGEYLICIEARALVEFVATLLQVAAEPIALLKQSKGCGKNVRLTGVCTACINAVNKLLDFGSDWDVHWIHCSFSRVWSYMCRCPASPTAVETE